MGVEDDFLEEGEVVVVMVTFWNTRYCVICVTCRHAFEAQGPVRLEIIDTCPCRHDGNDHARCKSPYRAGVDLTVLLFQQIREVRQRLAEIIGGGLVGTRVRGRTAGQQAEVCGHAVFD